MPVLGEQGQHLAELAGVHAALCYQLPDLIDRHKR
jgi:hypothetical protein